MAENYNFKSVLPFLIASLALAALISPFASSWPDGLEKVAETLGFGDFEAESAIKAPLPDYGIPGMGEGGLSTAMAGLLGVLICFGLPFIYYFFRKK